MPLIPLTHHYAIENPASVYDEEAMTALELAGRTTAKVNETVEAFNKLETETNAHLDKQDASIPVKIAEKVQEHIDGGRFDAQVDKFAGELEKQIYTSEQALNARIDNLSKMAEGSTTGDAELADARVSDVGQTHVNVGKLIRTNLGVLRLHTAADCVKELELYSRFENKYVNGAVNNTDDCITIHPPVKFSRYTTIRPLPGYEVSCQRYSNAEGTVENNGYLGWTNQSHLLEPEHYYSICLRHVGGHITLDEGSALIFEEPFYYKEVYSNALDTILPLMRHGGFSLDDPDCYYDSDKTAMYSKGGFTLTEPAVLHCSGEAFITFHSYDGAITPGTFLGDNGWAKEVTIPANTLGVLYFKANADRRTVTLDDLKTIHYGHSIDVATDKGNINRIYATPERKAIAHRGYTNYGEYAPENTIPAFRLAKAQGFNYVECDVRITADGVPVICHDLTVDRTSNGTGYVHQMTVDELKKLDFSVACNVAKYAGTKMPTLEETLISCKNMGLNLYLEIEPECIYHEPTIVNLVKAYGMENAVTYVSFSWNVLFNIAKMDDSAPLGFLKDGPGADIVGTVKGLQTGYNDAFLDAGNITDEVIEACKSENVPVEIWCVDDIHTLRNLNPYVRGVTSEYTNYKTVMYDMEMEGI